MSSILTIGPDLRHGTEGGVTLPFSEFCAHVKREAGVPIKCMQLRATLPGFISILWSAIFDRSSHVVLHATWRALWTVGLVLALSKTVNKRTLVLRKFAGDFDQRFNSLPPWRRRILGFVLRRFDLVFFETKYLVSWASAHGLRAAWWPNSREAPGGVGNPEVVDRQGKLIYLGRVCRAKGVLQLSDFAKRSLRPLHIDIYGPLEDAESVLLERYFADHADVLSYKGVLTRDCVFDVLQNYQALLLPTSWESEGYPGVIIEAAMLGVPTIASMARGPGELLALLGCGTQVDFEDADPAHLLARFSPERRAEIRTRARHLLASSAVHRGVLEEIAAL